ncbi:polysaccharide deacetylase family protein [Aurantimonas sp. C2-6-R+9]|uniref:polysaccharide deacetylase family protein n=1 Tax=unclassified Aurantimonas TaxID=2638230 RepID=UPI002E172BD9|nr:MULTISPECIES: polysaccharide deacetylase family protein [unclassified Aurantimonas]MEC5289681.1 polysaccharide deacetylase family protein [Aurantimonas sp. C2-3-R2]MEC5379647.1 polysaccharide deacetylase family protein [Aurantimonas sp. C2-6-R+9]MEC5410882.1 polysaccharide deacetylase family protein [Aurantimonas sp. C2-4-R8]
MQGADALLRELDHWVAEGRTVALWWRDDDATQPTPALSRLVAAARDHSAPLALAVIPARMSDALVPSIDDPLVRVLQHGFAHQNHAAAGERAVECGGDRPATAVLDELAVGRARLVAAFGSRFCPVMVPPWNRIEPAIAMALPGHGFVAVSVFGPRSANPAGAGSFAVNAHLDLLTWKGGARFAGRDKLLRLCAERLADRRCGQIDPDEPFGLLTHHLDHDAETWAFLDEILGLLAAHPAVCWTEAGALFADAAPGVKAPPR